MADDRLKKIDEVSTILQNSRQKLNDFLSELGWNQEILKTGDDKVKCLVNQGHTIPASSLQRHVYTCKIKSEGQEPKDVCPSSHFFYKNSLAVVPVIIDKKKYESFKQLGQQSTCTRNNNQETKSLDKHWQCLPIDLDDESYQNKTSLDSKGKSCPENVTETQNLRDKDDSLQEQSPAYMPLTMSAAKSELNPTQRAQLYDYVVQTAKTLKRRAVDDEMDDVEHLADNADSVNQPKTHLEALAEKRDYKRRRQSYRAKNVHMTKRSKVEVMRDLIDTQMKMLQEHYQEEMASHAN